MTYSVVARCPETGRLGVGVQSHYPAVASYVSWVQAGVGAIGTQALGNRMYGGRGLELMLSGTPPDEALAQLLADDDQSDWRQVALVDGNGGLAVHTGKKCVGYAGHVVGEGVVFQANVMRNAGMPEAMAESWSSTTGESLEQRLVAALSAAQRSGGDIRGERSAGIKVCDPVEHSRWWEGISIDLRVDDHPGALEELARLMNIRQSYRIAESSESSAAIGDAGGADEAFRYARELVPESAEIAFRHGVVLANAGNVELAKEALRFAYAEHDGWRELLRRFPAAGLLNAPREIVEELAHA